jgi:hypothetical protein
MNGRIMDFNENATRAEKERKISLSKVLVMLLLF